MKHTKLPESKVADSQEGKVFERVVYVERPVQPVEIECTSKVYKLAMLRGQALQGLGILMVIGFLVLSFYVPRFSPWQNFCGAMAILGGTLFVIGLCLKSWGKQMAWWNNG